MADRQTTFALVKPDGLIGSLAAVEKRIVDSGFEVLARKRFQARRPPAYLPHCNMR